MKSVEAQINQPPSTLEQRLFNYIEHHTANGFNLSRNIEQSSQVWWNEHHSARIGCEPLFINKCGVVESKTILSPSLRINSS